MDYEFIQKLKGTRWQFGEITLPVFGENTSLEEDFDRPLLLYRHKILVQACLRNIQGSPTLCQKYSYDFRIK